MARSLQDGNALDDGVTFGNGPTFMFRITSASPVSPSNVAVLDLLFREDLLGECRQLTVELFRLRPGK
jgi:hypothetical protein